MEFQSLAIDNDELIHNAVRQGHVISLEIYLNQNPTCINKLFTFNQSKWTPLLVACYYQHEHIVRMLLNRFKPDIEAKGTVVFDMIGNQKEIVEDVSPLWTAVAVDNFDIVRLLIEKGHANINHLTKTHSTTFRVACYNNNLEMSKYLFEHGANPYIRKIGNYTNLMLSAGRRYFIIVKYLVNELKCNINEQDENGQTALYYAIKSCSYEIVKFLLENGAMNIRDNLRKVTPLMRAALYGEINLVEAFDGYCSDSEWIEAKELLGASFGGCVARFENLNKTVEYLTEAFQLRIKKNLPKILSFEHVEIYNFRSECETLEQFNQLICSNSKDNLHIETIFIHQRLLGNMSKDYHHVLRYYGAILADAHRYNDCLSWWFYEMDLKQKYNISFKKEHLRNFIDIFIEMKQNNQMDVPIASLIRMLKIIDNELQSNFRNKNFDYSLHILLYIMTIIAQIIFSPNEKIKQEISINDRQELFRLIRLIMRHSYRTMKGDYPCWMTVRLLLNCGANIDVLDSNKNTPLHLIVQNGSIFNVIIIINILCNFGAHLDYVNNNGQIPIELVPSSQNEIIQHFKEKMGVRRLKCICAHLIQKECLLYEKYLSTSLLNFVQKH
ncbi:unnamed protein product [Rotaria sp. Silwood2]|nr:unnamed protein product [Rotaria sp. Silwood2]